MSTKRVALGQWVAGGDATLDVERLLQTRMLLQANSGNGKSWLLRRLLEVTAGLVQQLIIDVEGEFSTLREKYDLVICAATGGDALAHPKTAALLALRLLETRASAVLDISELKASERHSFVRIFLGGLLEAPKSLRHPVLVAIDEAQIFAPEKGQGESEASDMVIDIATRGRKRGLCLVAATQRISMFHKAVAAECKNRLIGGTSLDVDVKRAAFDLGLSPKEALPILRGYPPGKFSAFGPAFDQLEPREFVVGAVETSHPKVGHRQAAPPAPTKAILALLPQLADLPKEAEQQAKSIEDLRRELVQTKRELTLAKKAQPESSITKDELATEYRRGYSEGFEDGAKEARKAEAQERDVMRNGIVDAVRLAFDVELTNIAALPRKEPIRTNGSSRPVNGTTRETPRRLMSDQPGSIDKPMPRAMLTALAQHPEGLTKGQVLIHTGYRSSGPVSTCFAELARNGWTELSGSKLTITAEGLKALGSFTPLPVGAELRDFLLTSDKTSQMEKKMLGVLFETYPDPIAKGEILKRTGYASSGPVSSAFARLVNLGYANQADRGALKAADELFP
jgi:hypothetical protein